MLNVSPSYTRLSIIIECFPLESYTRLSIIIECFSVLYKTVNYYWMLPRHIQDCQLLLNVSPSYTRLSIIIEYFPVIYKTVNYYWMFPRHIQDCQLLLNVSPSYTRLSIIIECFSAIYKTQLLLNFSRHIQDSIITECFPVIYKTVNYYWMFPRHIQDCQLLLNVSPSNTRLSIIIECFPGIYKTVNYYWMFPRHIQDSIIIECFLVIYKTVNYYWIFPVIYKTVNYYWMLPRHIQDCQLLLNVSPSYTRLSIIIECFPVKYKTVNYYWMFPRHIQDCQLLLNVSPSYTRLSIIIECFPVIYKTVNYYSWYNNVRGLHVCESKTSTTNLSPYKCTYSRYLNLRVLFVVNNWKVMSMNLKEFKVFRLKKVCASVIMFSLNVYVLPVCFVPHSASWRVFCSSLFRGVETTSYRCNTLVLLLSIGIQILEIPICQKNSHVS